MRAFRAVAAAALLAGSVGCTHYSLARNTVLTTGTVMDIQYRSVLANLAMMSCHPEALPNHANLADGVVQVNDRAGLGQAGGFTWFEAGAFGIEQFGPSAQRQVTEQWGTDATTDPERLTALQDLYRTALGLPPLPPPNAIAYLRQKEADRGKKSGGESSSSSFTLPPVALGVSPAGGTSGPTSSGGGGSTPSAGGSSDDDESRRVPIEVLRTDVPPPGWYHVGTAKEVPKDACYVGCWGDRCCWVTADGVPALARFTLTVLAVIKLKPGEGGGKSGLAVTGSP